VLLSITFFLRSFAADPAAPNTQAMDPPPAHGGLASAVLLAARPPAARLDRGPAGALYGLAVGVALKLAWTAPAVVEVVEAVVETAAEDR